MVVWLEKKVAYIEAMSVAKKSRERKTSDYIVQD